MTEANRRAHTRHPMQIPVRVVDRNAVGPAVDIEGVTVNISLGGILALLKRDLAVGADSNCLVRFTDARGVVEPEFRWGNALRSIPVDGGYEVAIEFQTPLELLIPPDEESG